MCLANSAFKINVHFIFSAVSVEFFTLRLLAGCFCGLESPTSLVSRTGRGNDLVWVSQFVFVDFQ